MAERATVAGDNPTRSDSIFPPGFVGVNSESFDEADPSHWKNAVSPDDWKCKRISVRTILWSSEIHENAS
jgi:hypothetical protein